MMKRNICIIVMIILLMVITGCSTSKGVKEDVDGISYKMQEKIIDSSDNVVISSETSVQSAKLVYKATLYLETQDFDESYEKIDDFVSKYNGFYESAEISNGSYYATSKYRTGNFVIRIPTEDYDKFIEAISETIYISDKSETVENISQSYYETETHIKSLKIEIDRLQELMNKAENMSDIIAIEKALTEAENELEQYQSTLSKYDTLVDYSTITISLKEVTEYKGDEKSFFEEIKEAFVSGLENFVGFIEGAVLFVIEGFIPLTILIVIVIILKKTQILRKIFHKK